MTDEEKGRVALALSDLRRKLMKQIDEAICEMEEELLKE